MRLLLHSRTSPEKIRDGKVQAAGAIVGAVMKATKGQADAGRVRELILERVGVDEVSALRWGSQERRIHPRLMQQTSPFNAVDNA